MHDVPIGEGRGRALGAALSPIGRLPVCAENLIRVDDMMESLKLAE
jgi:hypothetical protein